MFKKIQALQQVAKTVTSPITHAKNVIKSTFTKPKKPKIGGQEKSKRIKEAVKIKKNVEKLEKQGEDQIKKFTSHYFLPPFLNICVPFIPKMIATTRIHKFVNQLGRVEKYSKNNFTFSIAAGSSLRTAQANTIIGADKIINTNSSFQSDCLASKSLPW